MKSSSDMGIPLVGIGLLYKSGYFHQKINGYGQQETEYHAIDISLLPITPVKDHEGKDLLIYLKFPKKNLYLKVWQIKVSRKRMKQLHKNVQETDGRLRAYLQECFAGMLVVRSYGTEDFVIHQASERMENHKAARMRRNCFFNICSTGFSALMNAAYVAGACFCGYGILIKTISYGTFVAVLQLIGQLQSPLANISGILPRFYAMMSSAERLLEAEKWMLPLWKCSRS